MLLPYDRQKLERLFSVISEVRKITKGKEAGLLFLFLVYLRSIFGIFEGQEQAAYPGRNSH